MRNVTDIIHLSIKGDAQAQRALYEEYRVYWYMLCMRYGKSKAQADDIFQEGLIKVYRDLYQYDNAKGGFKTWSSRVMVHSALRYLKKYTWVDTLSLQDEANEYEDNEETVYSRLAARELTQVIQHLPIGYRLVFNMYAIEGYSHKEIASRLEISVGTSKSQLSKARKYLRNKLESQLKITSYE